MKTRKAKEIGERSFDTKGSEIIIRKQILRFETVKAKPINSCCDLA